jgi:ParB family transcriptional regulator, chromosome partitioning protein
MTDDKKSAKTKAHPRGLGRGLSSLLGDAGVAAATGISVTQTEASQSGVVRVTGLTEIPIEWINPGPWQPRRFFNQETLAELASSIQQKGLVQPILVRPNPKRPTRYDLVAGERRWRAAQLAKLHVIPAIVRDLTDAEAYEIALIENIQRADLSAIEEALGYQKLIEHHHYTQEQLSEIVGKSRSHVANFLRLLALPAKVQDMVVSGDLTMGQVRPIINHENCLGLAQQISAKGLSARQAEDLARKPQSSRSANAPKPRAVSADIKALEEKAAAALGLSVRIDWDEARDKGVIRLNCQSLEQMDAVLAKLNIG